MDDDKRLWDDEALLEREGRTHKQPSPLQRMPARLVAGVILAGIVGLLLTIFFPVPQIVAAWMFGAGLAGAVYTPMALRHSSLVVLPAAVTAYVATNLLFFTAGLAVDPQDAMRVLPVSFALYAIFGALVLVGVILWAAIVRSFEDRLFVGEVRDAARGAGSWDYAITAGAAIVAVVWGTLAFAVLAQRV